MMGGKKRGEGGNKEIVIPRLHDTFSYTKGKLEPETSCKVEGEIGANEASSMIVGH